MSLGRRWILMLLMLWAIPLGAQPYALRRYDQRDGILHSQIFTLLEDRDGFLWMASGGGLIRMGAAGPQAIQAGTESRGFRNMHLSQDHHGTIWAATLDVGVQEVRGSRVTTYGAKEGLDTLEVYCVEEGAPDHIFAGTGRGLFLKQGSRFAQVPLPGRWRDTPIYSLLPDGKGAIWLGSNRNMLARWDGQHLTEIRPPDGLAPSSIRAIKALPGSGFWIMSNLALSRLRPEGVWETCPEAPSIAPFPSSMSVTPQGELLVCLGPTGLLIRHPDGTYQQLASKEGMPATGVHSALRDRRGTLWLGTDGEGLISHSLPGLRSLELDLETHASLGLGVVIAITEPRQGIYLFGTTNGLFQWEEGRGITQRWIGSKAPPGRTVYSIQSDGRGNAVVASALGLSLWKNGSLHPFCPSLARQQSLAIAMHEGSLWVSSYEGLHQVSLEGKLLRSFQPPPELAYPMLMPVHSQPGHLLLGSRSGMFELLVQEGRFIRIHGEAPFANGHVSCITSAQDGHLWVGTRTGVYHLPPGQTTWLKYGVEHGLLNGDINWIKLLPDETVAIGHNRGVTLLRQGRMTHLTRALGLISDETCQEGAWLDHKGRLWIGMVGGACVLDTQGLPPELVLSPPCLLEAAWSGHIQFRPERLDLAAEHGNVTFHIDTPWPAIPSPLRYETLLEGRDRNWVPLPLGVHAYQTAELPSGNYVLRVRSTMDGQRWSESKPLQIHVAKAWFHLWIVRLLLLSVLVALVALLLRFRTRNLERRNADLEAKVRARTEDLALRSKSLERLHAQLKQNLEGRVRLMNTVTHDLRSPLTTILITVDRLREGCLAMGEDPTLNVLEREARRLDDILRAMLDKGRSEAYLESLSQRVCHPAEITSGLADTLSLRAASKGLTAEVDLDPRSEQSWVLADVTSLQQVLFNLMENALKFTPAPGKLGLRSRVEAAHFVFEVWDTGRGIPPEKLPRIFEPYAQTQEEDVQTGWGLGLSICKQLVEAHQGTLTVESRPGWGSTFQVTLPLIRPHDDSQGLTLPTPEGFPNT